VRQSSTSDMEDGSVLVAFDTAAVLDELSLGIVVLDAQLCAVYANVLAENLLTLQVERVRGQPLASFLPQPQRFLDAVRRALESGETVEFELVVADIGESEPRSFLPSRICPVRNHVTGTHLLLQVSGNGCMTR